LEHIVPLLVELFNRDRTSVSTNELPETIELIKQRQPPFGIAKFASRYASFSSQTLRIVLLGTVTAPFPFVTRPSLRVVTSCSVVCFFALPFPRKATFVLCAPGYPVAQCVHSTLRRVIHGQFSPLFLATPCRPPFPLICAATIRFLHNLI